MTNIKIPPTPAFIPYFVQFQLKTFKKTNKKTASAVLPGVKRPTLVVCGKHAQSLVYFSSSFEDNGDNGEVINFFVGGTARLRQAGPHRKEGLAERQARRNKPWLN